MAAVVPRQTWLGRFGNRTGCGLVIACVRSWPHLPPAAPPQSHLECRLWNEIFVESQRLLGIPNGGWAAASYAASTAPTRPDSAGMHLGCTCSLSPSPSTSALHHPSSSLPPGTIKATCLIETLPAAFEMHEFLYELRDHSAGTVRYRRLDCGVM